MKLKLLILFLVILKYSPGQNLIRNYSFEEVAEQNLLVNDVEISKEYAATVSKRFIAYWNCPTKTYCPIIRHFKTSAHTGNTAVSIVTYTPKGKRNYLEQEIALSSGKYFMMFYAKPLAEHKYLANNLGVLFSESPLSEFYNITPNFFIPTVLPEGWALFSRIIELTSPCNYLYLANFFSNKQTKIKRRKGKFKYSLAAYNLDDVLLFKIHSPEQKAIDYVMPTSNIETSFNFFKYSPENVQQVLKKEVTEEKAVTIESANEENLNSFAQAIFHFYILNNFNFDNITLVINPELEGLCKITFFKL